MKKDLLRNNIKPKKHIKIPNLLALYIIRFYKYIISPMLAPSCRFYPSCSSYAFILLRFDNVFLACIKIFVRILTCNPLFHGGFSPPYIHLSNKAFDDKFNTKRNLYMNDNIFAIPHIQKPQQTTYFFVNSNSYLLKLKKFYIIAIYL